jgi:chemotaxis protein methyltransferase CheR
LTLVAPPGVPLLLSSLVHERIGIHFEADRWDVLLEKLEPVALSRHCASFLDLYYLLKYEEHGTEDWERVMDALSVPETYFWREMAQIHVCVNTIAPAWFARTSLPLRIWSAACATGEEAYSLAIALAEAGLDRHPIEILASDSSSMALEKARSGLFREKSFRALPFTLREKYFLPEEGRWRIKPEIGGRVSFRRANLLAADEVDILARCPVVFCRNVFIYFSPHAIRQTLAIFASRMPVGGHLFVGASESLLKLTADFELREFGDAFGYVRI